MDVKGLFPEGVEFFPEHPSQEKTKRIQTSPSPLLEQQKAPFEVKSLYMAFEQDLESSLALYEDRRFQVTGVAICVERDIHGLPTVELSDRPNGPCYAHCIFPAEDVLHRVSIGDKVTILSNYLVFSHPFGIVMKYSELLRVEP